MAVTARFTDKPVAVNFAPGVKDKLQKIADRDGVSLNAVVRHLADHRVTIVDLEQGDEKVGA